MNNNEFWLDTPQTPFVVAQTASYLALYKPPQMHSAPIVPDKTGSLFSWAVSLYPELALIKGRKEIEGGLVHRLDYATQGLVLFARTQDALDCFMTQQQKNQFIKEYDAVALVPQNASVLPGFPPFKGDTDFIFKVSTDKSAYIESAFRPYGKGRKVVRPLPVSEPTLCQTPFPPLYRTEIISYTQQDNREYFRIRLTKGFRHQIRCHLAWIQRPLLNDQLYGGVCTGGFLALRACSLMFNDPQTGKKVVVSL